MKATLTLMFSAQTLSLCPAIALVWMLDDLHSCCTPISNVHEGIIHGINELRLRLQKRKLHHVKIGTLIDPINAEPVNLFPKPILPHLMPVTGNRSNSDHSTAQLDAVLL
jgi:hypothetical protein